MRSARFWIVVLLMSFTALVLQVRGDQDKVVPSRPLNELPATIGARVATDIPIDQETREILGKGDFLERDYRQPRGASPASPGDRADISLYIAYFPTQRTGQ